MTLPGGIEATLAAKRGPAEIVLDHVAPGDDVIVGLGNAEPVTIIDAVEAAGDRLSDLRLHQMLPLRDRRYIEGEIPGCRHFSWFLSPTAVRPTPGGPASWSPTTSATCRG